MADVKAFLIRILLVEGIEKVLVVSANPSVAELAIVLAVLPMVSSLGRSI